MKASFISSAIQSCKSHIMLVASGAGRHFFSFIACFCRWLSPKPWRSVCSCTNEAIYPASLNNAMARSDFLAIMSRICHQVAPLYHLPRNIIMPHRIIILLFQAASPKPIIILNMASSMSCCFLGPHFSFAWQAYGGAVKIRAACCFLAADSAMSASLIARAGRIGPGESNAAFTIISSGTTRRGAARWACDCRCPS